MAFMMTDKTKALITTTLAMLQNARGQLRATIDRGIERAENASHSLFRFARTASQRVDERSAALLTSLAGALEASRDTARADSTTSAAAA